MSRAQLLDQGWTKEEIDWRIRAGRLHRVHDGVYAVGHRLIPKQGWWMAAVLASGPDALLSHQAAAEYLNRWDRLSLPELLQRYPGKRGSRKLRFALERITEEPPVFNDWILLGAKRYRVDCHWPHLRLIVELDGWQGHSTRSAFQDDRARDRALHAAGYSVIHLTWKQLDVEPAEVASDLRRLLR